MRTILFILLTGIMLGACSSDDEQELLGPDKLEVSKNEVKLTNIEGAFNIHITATGVWSAEVTEAQDNWLTLSKTSGNGEGDFRLLFTENTGNTKRTGKIQVSMQGRNSTLEQEITIEQLGSDPDILLDYSTELVPFTGTTLVCRIVANIAWEIVIDEKNNWIKVDPTSENYTFTTDDVLLNIAGNTGARRKGEAVVKATGGYVLSRIIEIEQEEINNTLAVEQDEYIIPYRCSSFAFPITQDNPIEYDIESAESWITLDRDASTANIVVLQIEDNNTILPRVASVTIRNSVLKQTVQIFQYGKPDTSIGDDPTAGQLLAFPGAEGGGRFTTGGRGGEVYHVTTLEDYLESQTPIPGSFRYGIRKSDQPRIIVFDVSGIIELKEPLFLVDRPNVSIIGQTAPGDGITIKDYNFSFNLSRDSKDMNAIIRFMRFRPGDRYEDYQEDAIGGRYFTNAIVDHVTASWSIDETFSFYGCQNFTAQWSITSESLNVSGHDKGAHGYGAMFSGDNASFHHILLTNHSSRAPRISDLPEPGQEGAGDHIGYFDVRNNVYYNWSSAGQGCYGGKYATFNIVNCYYKGGPATGTGTMAYRILSGDPQSSIYIDGNYTDGYPEVTADNWTLGVWGQFWRDLNPTQEEMEAMRMSSPHPFDRVTSHTAELAYDRVLEYAGASLRRDIIDQRIVNEVRSGTTTHIGSIDDNPRPGIVDTVRDTEGYPEVKSLKAWPDTDGDGIPDIWEIAYGLDPNDPTDATMVSTSVDPNGRYSNLEVYFHNLVQHIIYYRNQGGQPLEKR